MPTESGLRLHRACFTGHRPHKLHQPEAAVIAALEDKIRDAVNNGFITFISGMAWGINNNTKLLIQTAAKELTAMNELLAVVRAEMIRLAKELPEYETVNAMYGVGESTAAQLIAEIGDIRNYPRRSSLVGFAGIDPEVNQSGKMNAESNPSTKRGSPHLRKTLFQIMTVYLQRSPADEAVYQFLDKKRAEGKPYYVYMTAGANKFLRIYYAQVKECIAKLNVPAEVPEEND